MSVDYVQRTFGLDSIDKQKLDLLGPNVLETNMQIEKVLRMEHYTPDVRELVEQQGEYGNVESLNYLGISYLQGTPHIDRNFVKAKEMFLKVLEIEPKDPTANTELGLMHMMGLLNNMVPEAETAISYFDNSPTASRALNAKAVIYWSAPDVFEVDPDKLRGF